MKYEGDGDWKNLGKIRGKWQIMGCPDVILQTVLRMDFVTYKEERLDSELKMLFSSKTLDSLCHIKRSLKLIWKQKHLQLRTREGGNIWWHLQGCSQAVVATLGAS